MSQRPQKQHVVVVYPKVLCLVLKRAAPNGKVYDHTVCPSRTLRLDSVLYRLRSVVVHRGGVSGSGHYWAVCEHIVNGKPSWWLYNDSVRKIATDKDLDAGQDANGPGRIALLFYEQVFEVVEASP